MQWQLEGEEGRDQAATGKKRSEEHRKGNLVYSQEITSCAVLFMGLLAVKFTAPIILEQFAALLTEVVKFPTLGKWDIAVIQSGVISMSFFIAKLVLPIALTAVIVSVAATMSQTGPFFELKPLEWKWSSLSPINGFRNLFSMQSVVNLGFSLLKLTIVILVIYFATRNRVMEVTGLTYMTAGSFIKWTMTLIYDMTLAVVVLYIIIAVIDWYYRDYRYEYNLLMTKQEVKDEHKQQEQNPIIKQAQRKKMRQVSAAGMMAAVPKATVVITNPTHVAVALEYESDSMGAPKVVAKGLRLMAERIKAVARENNVPIIEKPELARALYKNVEIGKEIPAQFYEAVAELLAYLHRLGRKVFNTSGTPGL